MSDKRFLTFFCALALFLSFPAVSGIELFLDWAKPLKKELVQLNKREIGGIVNFGENVLVATRSGRLHLFTPTGKIKKTLLFDGEFSLVPLVLDDGSVIVTVSNSVIMLDSALDQIWSVAGKAPVASTPLVEENNIFVQFHDNSIYMIERSTGAIRTAYTSYSDEDISYLRLPAPLKVDDKYVFGFSNGSIVFFMLRQSGQNAELVPYFRFKTAKTSNTFDKKNFFDLLSIVPHKDTVLFSGGEYGGLIIEGKPEPLENMRNINIVKKDKKGYTGFGEGGIFLFDEEGVFVSKPFSTNNYVTNLLEHKECCIITTTGEGSIISYSEGHIFLLCENMKKQIQSIMVPNGISGKATLNDGSLFVLSDKGVVYKFKVVE
jgi:outer membrane protein assembly factor BamB